MKRPDSLCREPLLAQAVHYRMMMGFIRYFLR